LVGPTNGKIVLQRQIVHADGMAAAGLPQSHCWFTQSG